MKSIFSILCLAFIISSCGKDAGISVDEYIELNNLTTTELNEGVHIIIHEQGNSVSPIPADMVNVAYKGMLTNGDVFDESEDATFRLGNLIRGWQIGLAEIGEGGSATLIIPPGAGYGNNSVGSIPPGSTLIFEMDLKKVN